MGSTVCAADWVWPSYCKGCSCGFILKSALLKRFQAALLMYAPVGLQYVGGYGNDISQPFIASAVGVGTARAALGELRGQHPPRRRGPPRPQRARRIRTGPRCAGQLPPTEDKTTSSPDAEMIHLVPARLDGLKARTALDPT
jgi:hypothetical protein